MAEAATLRTRPALAVVCSGLQCLAVVLMGLGRIPPNVRPLKFNDLRHQRTPENPWRLFRNQQVAGSSPAGGSNKIKKLIPHGRMNGWYFGWYSLAWQRPLAAHPGNIT